MAMAEGMIITYETLFDLLRREKSRDELQELDHDFYRNVQRYLEEKKALAKGSSDGFMDEREKLRIQVANIKKIIKELYERRERKVVNLALFKARLNNKLLDTRALLPEEKSLFERFAGFLADNRDAVLNPLLFDRQGREPSAPESVPLQEQPRQRPPSEEQSASSPEEASSPITSETESEEDAEQENKTVRFTGAVPKFLGTELEVYGPFEEEDVAKLPAPIADVLIKKGRAEELAKPA